MDSLPAELVFDILDYALQRTRYPRKLLKRTSLISPTWRSPSQALLFRHFSRLRSVEDARSWMEAEWSEFAEVLNVEIPGPSEEGEEGKGLEEEEVVKMAVKLKGLPDSPLSHRPSLSPPALNFVHGASPPPFSLLSLSLSSSIYPGILIFLLPALTTLTSLSIGIDQDQEENPIEAICHALATARRSLSFLALRTTDEPPCLHSLARSMLELESLKPFEYHGVLCEYCAYQILPSLPCTVEEVFLSATPYDFVAVLVHNILCSEDIGGGGKDNVRVLPKLKTVTIPSKSRKLMGEEGKIGAEARGVEVRGFRFVTGF
ncbi:hypothetical protein JCM11251_003802 [Rhodosporidiobolus azoricus]